jgi:hypothetical protein
MPIGSARDLLLQRLAPNERHEDKIGKSRIPDSLSDHFNMIVS